MATHPLWRPFAPFGSTRENARVARRQVDPGPLERARADWAVEFGAVRATIRAAIPEQVLRLRHVGSTAVPGLLAKPVLDIDLTVPDVDDEERYLPRLEGVGFRLIFRDDLAGDPHRQLTLGDPNTNLHVWSPSAIEPRRHELFVARLLTDRADRELYAAAKDAARRPGVVSYNDAKAEAVYDVYERAFAADPLHEHSPHPRPVS